jgi:bifunctional non-homologous end joining protein LigD
MAEKLRDYKRKRRFEETPEPAGARPPEQQDGLPRFVIQEHDATRLHWDLRLEHDGVAASWAIPNGIPQDPSENRLAVHVEDHPLEYLEFEGDIPKGQYGAGTMRIWDAGTYQLHKWEPKEVMLTFHGERVQGRYVLFQTRSEKDWMIHRMDSPVDPDREPMPDRLVPMLAKSGDLPRNESAYGFEVKWDGIRAVVYYEPGRFRIESRKLSDITFQYPELSRLGRQLGSRDAVIDGEIVAFGDDGKPSFERLQQRMNLTNESQIKRRAKQVPVAYVAFDLLYLEGRLLMDLPYEERRERLEALELGGPNWQTPAYHRGEGKPLLDATVAQGLEGVVAKRLDSAYEPGRRSGSWIKVKNRLETEVVIGGWMPGEGRRESTIGALLAGVRDEDGKLRYAGRVGTGFTERMLDELVQKLEPLRRKTSPFEAGKPPKGAIFVEPRFSAEIEYGEWTKEKILRAPSFRRLVDSSRQPTADSQLELKPLPKNGAEATVEGRRLKLSNLNKVMYPKTGFTKGDLIDYYARVAPTVLPHLRDRPLTLKRYPDGVEAEYFYEKQCPSHRPDWVETASIYSRRNERPIDYCLANDVPTLVWLANLADIELHTSLSLADAVDQPTMMVFDLDPGAPADIVQCCQVGVWLSELFDQLGLESFAKTSGSKGLQVYVPLNVETTYDETKPFSKAVAELLEKQHKDLVVSRQTKELRPGKVLVDWSQNDEHKTTVNVYSVRAKERPTVSTPVTWEEVHACLDSEDAEMLVFDTEQVLARIDEQGDLFAPVLAIQQELPRFG